MGRALDALGNRLARERCKQDIIFAARWNYGFIPKDENQRDILQDIRREDRIAMHTAHGIGKTAIAAIAVLDFLDQHNQGIPGEEGAKVVTTAPVGRQVDKMLWSEIRKWWRQETHPGWEILPSTSYLRTPWDDTFALGFSTDDLDRFEGWHSPNLMIVVDEAKGVNEAIFTAIKGSLTTENVHLIYLSTPGNPQGAYYRACKESKRFHTIHIDAFQSKNVRKGYADEILEDECNGDRNHPIYIRKVLGEFARMVERPHFNENQVLDAVARLGTIEPIGYHTFGVDWGRKKDWTVVIEMMGPVALPNILLTQQDYMKTVDYIVRRHKAFPFDAGKADLGEGVGQVERLIELGVPVKGERMTGPYKLNACSKINIRLQTGLIALPDFQDRRLPNWGLKEQLIHFQESETPTGQKHLEGDVDDMVDALMLCVDAQDDASHMPKTGIIRTKKGPKRKRR